MQISTVNLVYFSPTGTTRKIVRALASGIHAPVTEMDLTPPHAGEQPVIKLDQALTIIGVPVYAGRVPAEAAHRLRSVQGQDTPAVLVVVYGNRAFEDALLELADLTTAAGFAPLAGAAFIGEHSYSTSGKPLAPGRPDAEDLMQAAHFGGQLRAKLAGLESPANAQPLTLPGNRPYRSPMQRSGVVPITQADQCILCGKCAAVCPTAAVVVRDTVETDPQLCIICCACIKNCPTGARQMQDEGILQLSERLYQTCTVRKEPEVFL